MRTDARPLFHFARDIARRPGVRPLLEPIAALVYGVRNRRLSAEGKWGRGASFEVAHWDERWFADARARGLLDPQMRLEYKLVVDAVDRVPIDRDPVRILDVGAGPLTPLGKVHPRRRIAITACDALARDYDRLLAQEGIEPPVRTVFAEGERLSETFSAASFDIVHCSNALDHHHDPIAAVEQMLMVTRPGGSVLLSHSVDEGAFRRYLGMHQWNINARDGHMIIWNRSHEYDISELLGDRARVTCTLRATDADRPHLNVEIARLDV